MHVILGADTSGAALGQIDALAWVANFLGFVKVLVGFSIIIFVHELGHFLAAKWAGVRVDRFAVGFGYRVCGYRRGEGFTFGRRPDYSGEELRARGLGETDYCINVLPLGGYVKMLGHDDIMIDEKTNEVHFSKDPRAFNNRPVGRRMIVVSAGVVFNLLFAALLLMGVFLIGKQMPAPVIGNVIPGRPAAQAGLLPGDRIVTIDGAPIDSMENVLKAQILSTAPLRFAIERNGRRLDEEVVIDYSRIPDERERIDILGARTTELITDGHALPGREAPKAGDVILAIDDQPVSSGADVDRAFMHASGAPKKLTVRRRDPRNRSATPAVIDTWQRASLSIGPADASNPSRERVSDSRHILGLLPRASVARVVPGSPAAKAGFLAGDVIAEWDTLAAPVFSEIKANIRKNAGKPVRVAIERYGERKTITVTPRTPFSFLGSPDPEVGIQFGDGPESDAPVVALAAPGTPAAELALPRGAVLLQVGGRAVQDWFDVVGALKSQAGERVTIRYRTGDDEAAGPMSIPSSVVNELGLAPLAVVLSIDGADRAKLDNGNEVRLPMWLAVRRLLEQNVGRTVTVRYQPDLLSTEIATAQFVVRADNVDPWQMRVQFTYEAFFTPLKESVSAHGNPLKALAMGTKYTWGTVTEVLAIIKLMANRQVGVENVSGPVGIIGHAVGQAKEGLVDLLFFLAFLSANLAVINFLPLPVLDGGLMVFLLIEKIKGKPVSLKTQMISVLVGLALIVLCFLFVTIQDIARLFST